MRFCQAQASSVFAVSLLTSKRRLGRSCSASTTRRTYRSWIAVIAGFRSVCTSVPLPVPRGSPSMPLMLLPAFQGEASKGFRGSPNCRPQPLNSIWLTYMPRWPASIARSRIRAKKASSNLVRSKRPSAVLA